MTALFPGPASLAVPLIGAPMFIASGPELVIAQCTAGIVGTMPSLSIRPAEALDAALTRIEQALAAHDHAHPHRPSAPYGVNLIAHGSNSRLAHDLEVCVRHRVPLVITSLGPSRAIVDQVHAYGGAVLHDVIHLRHARKAIDQGVDGIVAVAAGAGGHGGSLSPFALVGELRRLFDGWIVLAGALSGGEDIAAAIAMGADFAYMGTRFIATRESGASDAYKAMVLDSAAADIVYTPCFTGVSGNYLRKSIAQVGLDPDDLPDRRTQDISYASGSSRPKAWKDVWSAGQGVGSIRDVPLVQELVARFVDEYQRASRRVASHTSGW